ncbi:MAG TPA: outer-membrane lipoprotein carrier protein LolA [Alphaproteobacteria bacterium]|nr:outer-membrane lipoprotein carrier protein LolA [Alphaproteobacteria bacterium]
MRTFYLTALLMASTTMLAHAEASGVPANVRVAKVTESKATTPTYSFDQAARMIEDYFNAFTTLTAWFSQHSSNDQWTHEGTLAVKKPGQFVWLYQSPHRQRIISTGTAVYYVDDEGGQVTQLPLQGGIAKLLGAREVKLDKLGFRVTALKQNPQQLDVTLTPLKPDNQLKNIVLTFSATGAKPEISGLSMTDGLGAVTQVTLSDIKTGVSIDPKVFKFTPPQERQN